MYLKKGTLFKNKPLFKKGTLSSEIEYYRNTGKKTNTPYASKQPLMMACEGSESVRDNFRKFIYQFQPETKTLIRKLERILNKLYRQNLSISFNETCLNERLLPNNIYIYI